MTPVLVSLVFVFVVGFPPAVALSRSWTLAVPLSAPVSLVVCGCSAFVSVVFGLLFLPTLAACSLFATAWSAWSVWRVAPSGQASSVLQGDGALAGFISAVLGLVILCYRSAPPGAWDANVIWWFHASWFEAGRVRSFGNENPLFLYSQPDYPPGDPAVIAGIWRLTGSRDLHYAQAATSILTALTVANSFGAAESSLGSSSRCRTRRRAAHGGGSPPRERVCFTRLRGPARGKPPDGSICDALRRLAVSSIIACRRAASCRCHSYKG